MLFSFSIDYVIEGRSGKLKCFTTRGVLDAANISEAEDKVWSKLGSDYACNLQVHLCDSDFYIIE